MAHRGGVECCSLQETVAIPIARLPLLALLLDSPNLETPDQTGPGTPSIKSLQDLTIIEAWDPASSKAIYTTFYHVTGDEEVYFGQSPKGKREISLDEYQTALQHVRDDEIYPEIPVDEVLTIAPDHLDDTSAFVKRPGLDCYETMRGAPYVPRSVLDETLVMERISKTPHPNIIRYHGCRTRRGRITSLVLERLDQTLAQLRPLPTFEQIDRPKFLASLQSAVDHLHSLGLAHNDVNPDNVMVRGGEPVLIDFGSCQPFGARLQSLGTTGWCEEVFYTSEEKHDEYPMRKMGEWLDGEI